MAVDDEISLQLAGLISYPGRMNMLQNARTSKQRLPLVHSKDMDSRFPIDPFPSSWYGLAFTDEIPRGSVQRLQFLGREVVAFRTASGTAAVFEAYCPHLGAHLGRGGTVVGENIRCPMHGLQFNVEGACTDVGSCRGKPPAAKAGVIPVREVDGVVFVWHGAEQQSPSWDPPQLAEPQWSAVMHRKMIIRTHPQDLAENLFDEAHLVAVHGYSEPEMNPRPRVEGHVIHGSSHFYSNLDVGPFKRRVRVDLVTQVHGLGIHVIDSHSDPGDLAFRAVFTPTPLEPGVLDFRVSIWIKQIDRDLAATPIIRRLPLRIRERLMGELLLATMMRDARQDQEVLDHKRYIQQPGLAAGDGAIAAFRRWARQFYPQTNAA